MIEDEDVRAGAHAIGERKKKAEATIQQALSQAGRRLRGEQSKQRSHFMSYYQIRDSEPK
jgi:hypothetical protein